MFLLFCFQDGRAYCDQESLLLVAKFVQEKFFLGIRVGGGLKLVISNLKSSTKVVSVVGGGLYSSFSLVNNFIRTSSCQLFILFCISLWSHDPL